MGGPGCGHVVADFLHVQLYLLERVRLRVILIEWDMSNLGKEACGNTIILWEGGLPFETYLSVPRRDGVNKTLLRDEENIPRD